jgi:hypothetical protein
MAYYIQFVGWLEYVGDVGHPGAARLDSRGGRIRHLRRQDWTLTT